MIVGLTSRRQTVEEKLTAVKHAINTIKKAPNLSQQARARGLRSLENAYERLRRQLPK